MICTRDDEGRSWTSPRVVNDSPLDDRDTGVISPGQDRLLLSWFTVDGRKSENRAGDDRLERWRQGYARITDETVGRWCGAWVCTSSDRGESWDSPLKVPLTAPHGPICLHSGELLFFGKEFLVDMEGFSAGQGAIAAMRSADGGRTWERVLPDGAVQGMNSFGEIGYTGPCPSPSVVVYWTSNKQSSDKPREYYFRLYALDAMLDLAPGATKADLTAAMEGHIVASGETFGKFQGPRQQGWFTDTGGTPVPNTPTPVP